MIKEHNLSFQEVQAIMIEGVPRVDDNCQGRNWVG